MLWWKDIWGDIFGGHYNEQYCRRLKTSALKQFVLETAKSAKIGIEDDETYSYAAGFIWKCSVSELKSIGVFVIKCNIDCQRYVLNIPYGLKSLTSSSIVERALKQNTRPSTITLLFDK
mmetsp:Transcript_25426/g.28284  ORF Transcript_25426/g.28284 Transcript_25426/m.28284 type:complete len:119 (-) Transcript_25426:22-378(-)